MNTASEDAAAVARAFVLVHGGFHGGWCWARVADLLRDQGQRVFTPTLTGLGERSHLVNASVDCSLHIQDIVNVIKWERLNDVVLCGHSYGGMIIAGVADALPERVASLVFLDAAIPEEGKSTLDVLTPDERAGLEALTVEQGGLRMLPPFPAEFFNVNSQDKEMVDALCTPQPFATLSERIRLSGAFLQVAKKTYIRATGWAGTHPGQSYARIQNDPHWSLFDIPCGHDAMLDAPEELAKVLLQSM